MRCLLFLAVPLALAAQSSEPDQRVTQTLISEIQQLRVAIERSTLLNARTQLAISQLQMQEATVARLTAQLDAVKMQGQSRRVAALTEVVKEREEQRTKPEFSGPQQRERLEVELKNLKLELENAAAMEQQRAAREGEVAAALQAAQNQIADSRNRIAEMEKALDTAIQQLLKQK
jgi:hypothetical protein